MVQMTSRVGDVVGNIARIEAFLREAAARSVDIVCFPELSVSGYNAGNTSLPEPEPIPGPSTDALMALARRHSVTFLAGLLERGANGVVYNTQLVLWPDGGFDTYRKTHVPTTEIGTWSQGAELGVFSHPKARFGVEICYDSHFPEVSTALAERGAELLLLPHASGGPETVEEKRARWLRYMPARAYDNTVYAAVCNQVGDNGAGRCFAGVTFVCDPLGRVIAEASHGDQEEMVVADLKASSLQEARQVPVAFYRHFRRPELYERWAGL
jgi:predicted amidohydrolase